MVRQQLVRLKHLSYAVLAIVLLAFSCEVGLRIYDSYTGQVTRGEAYDQGLICKSWVMHHQLKPLLNLHVEDSAGGAGVLVETNSFGLRGVEPEIPKPHNVYRILCLGDDRTLGLEVPADQTYSGQLETILSKYTRLRVEVINAGVPDYCPLLSYLQVKHQLAILQPDLLILNFDMSDVSDDFRYRRYTEVGMNDLPMSCSHPGLQPPSDSGASKSCEPVLMLNWGKRLIAEYWTDSMPLDSSKNILSPGGRYAWLKDQPPDWTFYIQQSLTPITQLSELSRGMYGELLVAAAPVPWQISETASCGEEGRETYGVARGTICSSQLPFELLAEYCHRQGIPYCESSESFRDSENADRLFQERTIGFSSEGHRMYAIELAKCIVRGSSSIWETGGNSSQAVRLQREARADLSN